MTMSYELREKLLSEEVIRLRDENIGLRRELERWREYAYEKSSATDRWHEIATDAKEKIAELERRIEKEQSL